MRQKMKPAMILFLVIYFANCVAVPAPCQNGGTYDGIKCVCRDNLFYGPKCEFLVEDVPIEVETVNMVVEAKVRITNRNFSAAYENKTSQEYKDLEAEFTQQMNTTYKDVPGYQGVEILALRKGSIIVEHKIIVEASIRNNVSIINATLDSVIESVEQAVRAINNTQNCTGLCFSVPPDPIINRTAHFSAEDICKSKAGPVYEKYYYPNMTTGVLLCMSDCTKGTSRTRNCNYGDCRISERGPACYCNDLAEFWYQGDFCRTRFRKRDVGFGLALAALAVIGTIMTIFFFRAKRGKSRSSWSEEAEVCHGEDEKEEQIPTGALSIANEAAASVDSSQGRSKGFQPSLGMVDPSVQLQIQ